MMIDYLYYHWRESVPCHQLLSMPTRSMKAALKLMNWYVNTTLLYGFGRAVTYDFDGTGKYWNKKLERYETKEMLILDKIGRVMGRSFATIIVWPFMLGEDLFRLECHVRGKDIEEYK